MVSLEERTDPACSDRDVPDDAHAELLLTPRTPGGRMPRKRMILQGCAFVCLVVAAVAYSQSLRDHSNQSSLRGVIGLAESKTVKINVTIRDFKRASAKGGHPDMQPRDAIVKAGLQKGLVEAELGSDDKPVFVGKEVGEGVTKGLTTEENFNQWYRDVPGVNKRVEEQIEMKVSDNGVITYENHAFFPMDGKGWKDSEKCKGCGGHNYFFTLEMHKNFTYRGGEEFLFEGDDDLWVFINKQLVVDLGGMHEELKQSVKLDTLGLEKGSTNMFHLFFAERHTTDSNFRVDTSIRLDEIVGVKEPGDEDQCCVLNLSLFQVFCAPKPDKSWYHFMCD